MRRSDDTQNILQRWREAVPDDRLAHLIKDVARAQMRALQSRLAVYGISFGHWTFLRILWEHDGLTQRELSDQAGVMEPTTFTAVKAMEKQGLLERRQLPGNRKNMHVYLTTQGRDLKARLVPLAEEVNHVSVQAIRPADVANARKVLLGILANLAQDESVTNRQSQRKNAS